MTLPAKVENWLGCIALLTLLVYAIVRSRVYCDCAKLWRRALPYVGSLLLEKRVVGGFVLALSGAYLMFDGAHKVDTRGDGSAAGSVDEEFTSELLRTHRQWFTRAQIMRSLAALMVLNGVLLPLQNTVAESARASAGKFETGKHTVMAGLFLLVYLLSHDQEPSSSAGAPRAPAPPVGGMPA